MHAAASIANMFIHMKSVATLEGCNGLQRTSPGLQLRLSKLASYFRLQYSSLGLFQA